MNREILNDYKEKDDKILLTHENNGTWSLPGGWCDVLESVASNTIKEVKEETGLDVETIKIIAVQDRNKHNKPIYAYGVCKIFVLCNVIGGEFIENIEGINISCDTVDGVQFLGLSVDTPWYYNEKTRILGQK